MKVFLKAGTSRKRDSFPCKPHFGQQNLAGIIVGYDFLKPQKGAFAVHFLHLSKICSATAGGFCGLDNVDFCEFSGLSLLQSGYVLLGGSNRRAESDSGCPRCQPQEGFLLLKWIGAFQYLQAWSSCHWVEILAP